MSLPGTLLEIDVAQNQFQGSVDFKALPSPMQCISITSNKIEAIEHFKLPNGIKYFEAGSNKLSQHMLFEDTGIFFSSALETFLVRSNALFGTLVPQILPRTLQHFDISHNKFSGKVNIEKFPESLKFLSLEENDFRYSIAIEKLPLQWRALNTEMLL